MNCLCVGSACWDNYGDDIDDLNNYSGIDTLYLINLHKPGKKISAIIIRYDTKYNTRTTEWPVLFFNRERKTCHVSFVISTAPIHYFVRWPREPFKSIIYFLLFLLSSGRSSDIFNFRSRIITCARHYLIQVSI